MNLQDLHDYYLSTRPKTLKVQTASKLLIRLCIHLKLDTPEEITPQIYNDLPGIIEACYPDNRHKAIQDKSMLAEMIGRYGPTDGWQHPFEILLNDNDNNLRQFTLQSLEYGGLEKPELIIPYVEKYMNSSDEIMRAVSARIFNRIYSVQNNELFIKLAEKWNHKDNYEFLCLIHKNIQKTIIKNEPVSKEKSYQQYLKKITAIIKQLESAAD